MRKIFVLNPSILIFLDFIRLVLASFEIRCQQSDVKSMRNHMIVLSHIQTVLIQYNTESDIQ